MAKNDWEKQSEQDRLGDEIIKLRKLLRELEAKWREMPVEGE